MKKIAIFDQYLAFSDMMQVEPELVILEGEYETLHKLSNGAFPMILSDL